MSNKKLNDLDYESWLRRRKKKDCIKEFNTWFNYYHNGMEIKEVIVGQIYQIKYYIYELADKVNKLITNQQALCHGHVSLEEAIRHDVNVLKDLLVEQKEETDFNSESIDELYYKMDEMA